MDLASQKIQPRSEVKARVLGNRSLKSLLPTGTFDEFLPLEYVLRSLQIAGIGYWRIGINGGEEMSFSANESFLRLSGLNKDEFPKTFSSFMENCIHPDDRERSAAAIFMKHGDVNQNYDFIARLRNSRNGKWRWVHCFGEVAETDGQGKPKVIFGCIIDVDEAHEARLDLAEKEADLRQERQRIDSIIDAAGIIIWDWDLVEETIRYGDSVYGSKGMGEARPIKDPWSHSISPEDQAKVLAARQRHLDGENSHYEAVVKVRRPNGESFWAHDKGRVVAWDKQGRPTRMMGATVDISEKVAADKALDESRQRLTQLVEAANIAIWDWDIASDHLIVNNNYGLILGRDQDDLEKLGDNWFAYIHPDDCEPLKAGIRALTEGAQESLTLEYRLLSKDGDYLWFYSLLRAIGHDENGRPSHIVGAQVDFTEKKRLEERQIYSMGVIYKQKYALEKQLGERSSMLDDIRSQMEVLMMAPGLRLDPTQAGLKEELDLLMAEIETSGGEAYGSVARYMKKAFQFLGNEMGWYKAVLDNLPFPVSVFDLNRKWTYLNKPAAVTIGSDDENEIIGQYYRQVWRNFLDHKVAFTEGKKGEKTFIRQLIDTGKYYFCQNSILTDQSGLSIGFIETMQDITSAYEADSRMRLMMDATPMPAVVFNKTGETIDCNLEAFTLCGLASKKEYLEKFFDCMSPTLPDGRATASTLLLKVNEAFAKGRSYLEELHLRDVRGQDIVGEVFMTRVAWGDGYLVMAYFRDLREIRAARQKIDRERLLLKDIMEGCPIAFAMSAGDRIVFTNPFAHKTLGVNMGDDPSLIIVDKRDVRFVTRSLKKSRPINWRPMKVRAADGRHLEILLNAYVASYDQQKVWMAWLMDISELKKNERELEIARDQAEASTRAKSDFLANISHEIRTPMNAIIGLNHLLLQTELSDQQREYVVKGDTASKSLLHLINDILDFSKIEAGKLDLADSEFSLAGLLTQAVDLFASQAFSKGLEFVLDVSPQVPMYLHGDDFRILQIINNLVSNAIKFTVEGEISLTVELVSENKSEAQLRFTVTDSGIGIDPTQTDKLFSAFTQADTSHTRRYGGSGLGLAISKQLVTMMGGEIWCQSLSGHGSRFGFTVKVKVNGRQDRYLTRQPNFQGLNVLLADDNYSSRKSIEKSLSALGFTVITAANGQEAELIMSTRIAAGQKTDLLLVDYDMPGQNACETLTHIRELAGRDSEPIPVLMVGSGLHGGSLCQPEPVKAVIQKPFIASTLGDILGPILEPGGKGYNGSQRFKSHEGDPAEIVGHLAGSRILLVEDNEVNQLVARKILQKAGFEVVVAGNGQTAVELIKNGGNFDLVLMDIQMPVMDGLTAAAEIRRDPRFKDLPIVAMTAHAMEQDREKSLETGMNDHITKPLDLGALFSCLAKWLPSAPRSRGRDARKETE